MTIPFALPRISTALLLTLLLLLPGIAAASMQTVRLPMDDAWDPAGPSGAWLAEVSGAPDEDRVLLPSVTWWWALADGERIVSAELADPSESRLALLGRIPARSPLIGPHGEATGDAGSDALYPGEYALDISPVRFLMGRAFQSITLTPLRLVGKELLALRATDLRFEIGGGAPLVGLRPERPDFPLRERVRKSLGDALLNPESLPMEFAADRAVGGGNFPTDVPSVEGSAVDMVIVTVDSFADLCQTYADYKTQGGIATVVRTVEWIEARYPHGSDRSELIRNFLRDAYAKWSIGYVCLVGDAQQVPPRYAISRLYSEEDNYIPSDMYYACLDGDWNADHDQYWGEAADSSMADLGDETDLAADVWVGRLPAASRADCAILLAKSESHQKGLNTPYQDRVLMLGEVLFPLCYPDPDEIPPCVNIILHGAWFCESIFGKYTDGEHVVRRLYEDEWRFDPEVIELTVSAAFDSMSNGAGVVLHNGHGARQTMSVGNGSLDASKISFLDNGDNTFLLYMVNCTAGAFDYNCLAEAFLRNDDGGAAMVIGATREAFANVSDKYMNVFFDGLHTDKSMRVGDLHYASMNAYEYLTIEDTSYRWAQMAYILFADPSNWVHYHDVRTLSTNVPGSVPIDGAPLVVTVNNGGGLVADALVCLYRDGEDYQRAVTDGAGQATFTLNPETPGTYTLQVSARDNRFFSTTFTATAPGGQPLLAMTGIAIDDVAGGGVVGNGNGVPERGETVRLTLTVGNGGPAGATGATGLLGSSHPAVNILDATDSYGNIPASGSSAGSDSYLVEIAADAQDDEILTFDLQITCSEGIFTDDLFIEAAAPLLSVWRSDIDDSGGNGDGNLGIGETALFSVRLANDGRGVAQGVVATVQATVGSSLLIGSGPVNLGDLAALSTDLGPAAFTVSRVTAAPPELDLILTDSLGHSDTLTLLLQQPATQPTALAFDFLQDVTRLRLNWTPPASADAAAYVVYRAGAAGGPYAELSEHWVEHSTYEDGGLTPITSYWYRLQALSAAGLPGALTDSTMVTTNPALLAGWPVQINGETPGTPVIGDFTGNGEFEIFIGADLVYGFHTDGTELFDGDGDPTTIGPISSEGSRFFCSLAAGQITDSAGLELVAASWNSGEVFVFEFDDVAGGHVKARIAPGWPQEMVWAGGYGPWSSPSLADVDGDGRMEIFTIDIGGYMLAWNHDGTEVINGDNNGGTHGVFKAGLGSWCRGSTTFADVDGNGDMEIFVPTASGWLHGLDGNGSNLPGFPFHAIPNVDDGIYCSAAIGDVDGDGAQELVFTSENDSLYVINLNGTRQAGWPIHLTVNNSSMLGSTPALADVTGDGFPEIFVAGVLNTSNMTVGWLDGATASWLPGWPQISTHATQSSPIVGDVDGDGDLEVILANEDASIEGWHHDGTPLAGFPLITGDFNRATPIFTDADHNGNLDMLYVGWDRNIYLWTFPTAWDSEKYPWYTFLHDQNRTGNVESIDWIIGVEDGAPEAGRIVLDPNYPNPFNPKTTIRFSIASGAEVELLVYDSLGRRVATLVDEKLPAGSYQRSWDGRDGDGTPQASGIYFAKLRVGDRVESRKMTLLK